MHTVNLRAQTGTMRVQFATTFVNDDVRHGKTDRRTVSLPEVACALVLDYAADGVDDSRVPGKDKDRGQAHKASDGGSVQCNRTYCGPDPRIDCACRSILMRSSGATVVLETAPAPNEARRMSEGIAHCSQRTKNDMQVERGSPLTCAHQALLDRSNCQRRLHSEQKLFVVLTPRP